MKISYAFTDQSNRPGNVGQVVVDLILRCLKIIGRDQAGHIERNPAFQAKHHFLKRSVKIVDDTQVQPLAKHHRQTKHPLFGEILVCRHIFHFHIAAHKDILCGLRHHHSL